MARDADNFRNVLETSAFDRLGSARNDQPDACLVTISLPATLHGNKPEWRGWLVKDEDHPDHSRYEIAGADIRIGLATWRENPSLLHHSPGLTGHLVRWPIWSELLNLNGCLSPELDVRRLAVEWVDG